MSISEIVVSSAVAAGAFGLAVAILAVRTARRRVEDLRSRGLYPAEGRGEAADVQRLLDAGEKIMAIRCYRELHQVGLKEAKDAVELLQRKSA